MVGGKYGDTRILVAVRYESKPRENRRRSASITWLDHPLRRAIEQRVQIKLLMVAIQRIKDLVGEDASLRPLPRLL